MKKSLLALAVLGTFSGLASAQTSLTLYGIVDAGVQYEKGTVRAGDERLWRLESGRQSSSRIGFKGSEDLGGGVTGVFTLENGFNIDDGRFTTTDTLFNRQAWVGLNGGFGSVKLGRQQTPLYYAVNAIDPFGINLAGNAQLFFGSGLYARDPLLRTSNTINYTTPNISGFSAQVAYSFGETAGDTTVNRQTDAGISYANGPLNVQLAYHDGNNVTVTGTAANAATGATADPTPLAALGLAAATPGGTTSVPADIETAFLGATFDFRVAKAHVGFGITEVETAALGDRRNRNWLIGTTVPVGPGMVMASYNRNDVRAAADGVTNHYAIGYSHPVSKRTNFYTSFGYTRNDDDVRLNAFANGEDSRLFNLGVRHTF